LCLKAKGQYDKIGMYDSLEKNYIKGGNGMNVYVSSSEELILEAEKANCTPEQINIYIEPGRYELKREIKLSGKNIKFIGKGEVILTGSVKIDIDKGISNGKGIRTYNIKEMNLPEIKPIGGGPYRDYWFDYETMKPHLEDEVMGINLFNNNKMMPVSRYPKEGFLKIKEVCGETVLREPYGKIDGCSEGYFIPEDDIVYSWKDEKNAVLVGYWRYDWAMQRQRIESINDGVIKLDEPYSCFGYAERGHFYGINLKSALTEEGEWCFDHENGILYVIPFKEQKEFTVAVSERIFDMDGCENIGFENITFEETQKAPVYMENCKNIKLCGGTIRNTGSWAVIGKNCYDTVIRDFKIYATGGGGISLDGGDRNTLTASGNIIKNNEIYDTGYWHRVYTPGIRISGCGTTVKGNKVHDVPALGMLFHGNNHIFEKNDICNACYESNDCGGIYAGKDWSCRGNVIRYNYFHDMPGYNNSGCIGLYFDDAFSSAEVYGNIFENIRTGILIGGGRDFKVYSNTFINCGGISVDDRLDNWGKHSIATLEKYLNTVDYKSEIWQKAYPELTDILTQNIEFPEGIVIYDNISTGEKVLGLSGKSAEYVKAENNISLGITGSNK